MKLKLLYLFLLISCYNTSFAQEKEPIETDRPDQTETPAIVPKGMFQMENGFSFEKTDGNSEYLLLPSALWKYGLNDRFEFRLITEFASGKTAGTKISGINPVLVGFKVEIAEEKGIWPKSHSFRI
ncbi:hypothetical protein [Flavobacterium sp. 3HN19-14]|uniref:hypothetical protein n=1 Tax=Flavobacterium sp. 3HN19-14 TaxID=3448133 RepID=UPI003EE02911